MTVDERRRGRLKIFLGAAAGVGKTYAMLGEARDLKAAGVDVVIGYLEPHGRRATEDRAAGLEVAPRRIARVGGRPFPEMDTDWPLERLPQLCLVDELAHTNHPGGRNQKRWQDVEELLDAGIDVDTTVNIQHLGEPQQDRRGHRGAGARDLPRPAAARGRRGGADRPAPRRPAGADRPGTGLRTRQDPRGPDQLLPRRQPGRAEPSGSG